MRGGCVQGVRAAGWWEEACGAAGWRRQAGVLGSGVCRRRFGVGHRRSWGRGRQAGGTEPSPPAVELLESWGKGRELVWLVLRQCCPAPH